MGRNLKVSKGEKFRERERICKEKDLTKSRDEEPRGSAHFCEIPRTIGVLEWEKMPSMI